MAKKIRELMADSETMDVLHQSHDIFRREQDEQLVQWMNRWLPWAGGQAQAVSAGLYTGQGINPGQR